VREVASLAKAKASTGCSSEAVRNRRRSWTKSPDDAAAYIASSCAGDGEGATGPANGACGVGSGCADCELGDTTEGDAETPGYENESVYSSEVSPTGSEVMKEVIVT
jgi:hypothetical protein